MLKIVLAIVFTVGAFLLIFGILHLATGDEYKPRGGGWLAVPILCWVAANTVVNRFGYWSHEAAVNATRVGVKASVLARSAGKQSKSILEEAKQRESRTVSPSGESPQAGSNKKEDYIAGAKESIMLAGNPLPELNESCHKMLTELYGKDWVGTNHELVVACQVFLREFRFVSDPKLQNAKVFNNESSVSCLRNALNCIRLAGVFTIPTIPKQEPDPVAFALALGANDPADALGNPESDTNLVMLAYDYF